MRKIDMIVIHCTATRADRPLSPAELTKMHRKRGFKCCGYHYYVRTDGEICTMRPVERVGAHARGYNEHSIGIAYEGGLDAQGRPADTRTELQKQKRAAQTEIRQAQGQIRSNEGEIAANLRKVQVLETQIDDTHKSLDSLAAVSRRLSDTGVKLQSDIAGNQAELARLRAAYLKEIKQMRLHRAQTTGMAFLFSAKNFHQGLARMRYMRRIAEWRRSRTDAIGDQLTLLETQNRQLAVTRRAQDATVAETRNRQSRLGSDKQQLESLSARLRSDNQGLQSLIAKKRSEITSLDRKTAALIAQAQAVRLQLRGGLVHDLGQPQRVVPGLHVVPRAEKSRRAAPRRRTPRRAGTPDSRATCRPVTSDESDQSDFQACAQHSIHIRLFIPLRRGPQTATPRLRTCPKAA